MRVRRRRGEREAVALRDAARAGTREPYLGGLPLRGAGVVGGGGEDGARSGGGPTKEQDSNDDDDNDDGMVVARA